MSIEEARAKILDGEPVPCMCTGWPDWRTDPRGCSVRGCYNAHLKLDADIDELIREVKAEMPCYSEYDCCNASQECPDRLEAGGSHGCPTCQARAEKVEAT